MSAQGVQYPASTGFVKLNPTISNAIVTKFDPEGGYREVEIIEDEDGIQALWNFIDANSTFEVEVMPKTGFSVPVQGTSIAFTVPTATNALPLPGVTSTTTIHMLVESRVKYISAGNGKIGKYAWTGKVNANTTT